MPKLTFTCEHEHPIKKDVNVSTITYESNREYLGDILEDFRDFLKGCGFQIDGEIDVVDNLPAATNASEALELFPEVNYWYNEFMKHNTVDYSFSSMNDVIPTSFTSDTITIKTGTL